MPELDLTTAQAIRLANHDALEIRVANQTIWSAPQLYTDHTIFGSAPLEEYTMYNDLPSSGWVGANFYLTGYPVRTNWAVVGVRIWVPSDYSGGALGQSGFVAIQKVGDEFSNTLWGWADTDAGRATDVIDGFANNGSKTAFTNLHTGWNDVYLDQEFILKHGNGVAVGYTIGNGTYYVHRAISGSNTRAADGVNLFLAGTDPAGAEVRGEFGTPGQYADWSPAHYGVDLIVREPYQAPDTLHSIWNGIESPQNLYYQSHNDLPTDGWVADNYYSYSNDGPQEGWTLVGAKLWVPLEPDDIRSPAGLDGECGYYIKESGRITGEDDPRAIIDAIASSPTATKRLEVGWNEILFPEPIPYTWGAGIAIGWKVDDGKRYSATSMDTANNPVGSDDGAPFYLAYPGFNPGTERRGEFTNDVSTAQFSFMDAHYGTDIIMQEPPV